MLIKCPECGKEVSDKAKQCINCGYPLSEILEETELIFLDDESDDLEKNEQFDGVYYYSKDEPVKVFCPRCKSPKCRHYKEQKFIPEEVKTRYTLNLNPFKPFTLLNKKEKIVRQGKFITENNFICDNCGKIFAEWEISHKKKQDEVLLYKNNKKVNKKKTKKSIHKQLEALYVFIGIMAVCMGVSFANASKEESEVTHPTQTTTLSTTTEQKMTICLEFGVENQYASIDECTNGEKYYNQNVYPPKEVFSYIYKIPQGKYEVTYGYKYPKDSGIFFIEDDTIYEDEPGYNLYENIQYINAGNKEATQITILENQHIRLSNLDTKFIFTLIE